MAGAAVSVCSQQNGRLHWLPHPQVVVSRHRRDGRAQVIGPARPVSGTGAGLVPSSSQACACCVRPPSHVQPKIRHPSPPPVLLLQQGRLPAGRSAARHFFFFSCRASSRRPPPQGNNCMLTRSTRLLRSTCCSLLCPSPQAASCGTNGRLVEPRRQAPPVRPCASEVSSFHPSTRALPFRLSCPRLSLTLTLCLLPSPLAQGFLPSLPTFHSLTTYLAVGSRRRPLCHCGQRVFLDSMIP